MCVVCVADIEVNVEGSVSVSIRLPSAAVFLATLPAIAVINIGLFVGSAVGTSLALAPCIGGICDMFCVLSFICDLCAVRVISEECGACVLLHASGGVACAPPPAASHSTTTTSAHAVTSTHTTIVVMVVLMRVSVCASVLAIVTVLVMGAVHVFMCMCMRGRACMRACSAGAAWLLPEGPTEGPVDSPIIVLCIYVCRSVCVDGWMDRCMFIVSVQVNINACRVRISKYLRIHTDKHTSSSSSLEPYTVLRVM